VAFVDYVPPESIPEHLRVADRDNILAVHGVHPEVMRHHYDLYVELMHRQSPLSREEREMVGVVVSAINGCRY
jgi:alkylhydroperoxidase family enzyme